MVVEVGPGAVVAICMFGFFMFMSILAYKD